MPLLCDQGFQSWLEALMILWKHALEMILHPLLKPARSPCVPESARTGTRMMRVLIVDDNPHTRSALSAYLEGLGGIQVVGEACDGQDALDQLQCRSADVVLMDCQMPRMAGIEATRILKRRWPRLKVVLLTFYPGCQRQARLAGADAVLAKGCSADELIRTFRSLSVR